MAGACSQDVLQPQLCLQRASDPAKTLNVSRKRGEQGYWDNFGMSTARETLWHPCVQNLSCRYVVSRSERPGEQ